MSGLLGATTETACGTGVATAAIISGGKAVERLIATDIDAGMVSQAQGKAWPSNVSFTTADAHCLPFQTQFFDAGICIFGLIFFPDVQRALCSMRRVLKPGSPLHMVTWAGICDNESFRLGDEVRAQLYPDERQHFGRDVLCRFSQPGLVQAALADAGFSNVNVRSIRRKRRLRPVDLARNLLASQGRAADPTVRQVTDMYGRLLKGSTEIGMVANFISARA